jgi:hypothetical protein
MKWIFLILVLIIAFLSQYGKTDDEEETTKIKCYENNNHFSSLDDPAVCIHFYDCNVSY